MQIITPIHSFIKWLWRKDIVSLGKSVAQEKLVRKLRILLVCLLILTGMFVSSNVEDCIYNVGTHR